MQSRKNVANFLQRMATEEGYLVVKRVRTGKQQLILLLSPINKNAKDTDDQKIIRTEAVRAIAKQNSKLDSALKKGYATAWNQSPKRSATSSSKVTIGITRRGNNLSMILYPK